MSDNTLDKTFPMALTADELRAMFALEAVMELYVHTGLSGDDNYGLPDSDENMWLVRKTATEWLPAIASGEREVTADMPVTVLYHLKRHFTAAAVEIVDKFGGPRPPLEMFELFDKLDTQAQPYL